MAHRRNSSSRNSSRRRSRSPSVFILNQPPPLTPIPFWQQNPITVGHISGVVHIPHPMIHRRNSSRDSSRRRSRSPSVYDLNQAPPPFPIPLWQQSPITVGHIAGVTDIPHPMAHRRNSSRDSNRHRSCSPHIHHPMAHHRNSSRDSSRHRRCSPMYDLNQQPPLVPIPLWQQSPITVGHIALTSFDGSS